MQLPVWNRSDFAMIYVSILRPTKSCCYKKTGLRFKVLSWRLEKPGIEECVIWRGSNSVKTVVVFLIKWGLRRMEIIYSCGRKGMRENFRILQNKKICWQRLFYIQFYWRSIILPQMHYSVFQRNQFSQFNNSSHFLLSNITVGMAVNETKDAKCEKTNIYSFILVKHYTWNEHLTFATPLRPFTLSTPPLPVLSITLHVRYTKNILLLWIKYFSLELIMLSHW